MKEYAFVVTPQFFIPRAVCWKVTLQQEVYPRRKYSSDINYSLARDSGA